MGGSLGWLLVWLKRGISVVKKRQFWVIFKKRQFWVVITVVKKRQFWVVISVVKKRQLL